MSPLRRWVTAEWQVAEENVMVVIPTHVLFVAMYAWGRTNGLCTVPPTRQQPLHGFAVPSVTMVQMTEATSAGM